MKIKSLSLLTLFVLTALNLAVVPKAEAKKKIRGDGFITLYNTHLKEEVAVQFRNKRGKYDKDALAQINHALRCRKTHQTYNIRPELLDLVDSIQDYFKAKEVYVVSGYRSPLLNKVLFESGRKVSLDSPHMYGQALDIRIPGIDPTQIRDYADKVNRGGVGYYPKDKFVHVDIGLRKRW